MPFVRLKDDRYSVIFNPVGTEFVASPKTINKNCPIILHIGTGSNKNIETTEEVIEEQVQVDESKEEVQVDEFGDAIGQTKDEWYLD